MRTSACSALLAALIALGGCGGGDDAGTGSGPTAGGADTDVADDADTGTADGDSDGDGDGDGDSDDDGDGGGGPLLRVVNVFARDGEHVALDVYARGDGGDAEKLALGLAYADATDYLQPAVVEFTDTTTLALFEAGTRLPSDYDFGGGGGEIAVFTVDLPPGAQTTAVFFDEESSTGDTSVTMATIEETSRDRDLRPASGKATVRVSHGGARTALGDTVWTIDITGGDCFTFEDAANDQAVEVEPGSLEFGIYDLNEGDGCTGPKRAPVDADIDPGSITILILTGETVEELSILPLSVKT